MYVSECGGGGGGGNGQKISEVFTKRSASENSCKRLFYDLYSSSAIPQSYIFG